jgi:hypothetical protein
MFYTIGFVILNKNGMTFQSRQYLWRENGITLQPTHYGYENYRITCF